MHALFEKLMAQPDLLSMLNAQMKSPRKGANICGKGAGSRESSGSITLVSQSVEIIVAPKERFSREQTPSIPKWNVRNEVRSDMKRSWGNNSKDKKFTVYDVDPEEEKQVNEMRHKELVGKTIKGTFFMKDQEPHVKHWIRWNEKKCDNVYIPRDLAFSVFGGQPKSGAKVTCTITALGPNTATAWRKHPQCASFEIIPRSCFMSPPSSRSVTPSFRSVANTAMSSSSDDRSLSWMSRRTTARTCTRTEKTLPSNRIMSTSRGAHLTAVFDFRGDDRSRCSSMGSIMELEG